MYCQIGHIHKIDIIVTFNMNKVMVEK